MDPVEPAEVAHLVPEGRAAQGAVVVVVLLVIRVRLVGSVAAVGQARLVAEKAGKADLVQVVHTESMRRPVGMVVLVVVEDRMSYRAGLLLAVKAA